MHPQKFLGAVRRAVDVWYDKVMSNRGGGAFGETHEDGAKGELFKRVAAAINSIEPPAQP
jgi:hypothetical protein